MLTLSPGLIIRAPNQCFPENKWYKPLRRNLCFDSFLPLCHWGFSITVRNKLKRITGGHGAIRKESAWRAGDECGAQKPFIGGFPRLHKRISSVQIATQNHSAAFVIEVFQLALFISRVHAFWCPYIRTL